MNAQQPTLLGNVTPLPSRNVRGTCSRCGQKLPRLFKHVLSKGLINFLWHLYNAQKPTKLVDLPIDHSTFANAQKVAYFNLAKSKAGRWQLTERGLLFLGNQLAVEHSVFTRNGKVVERSCKTIHVGEVDEGWKDKLWYSETARAV